MKYCGLIIDEWNMENENFIIIGYLTCNAFDRLLKQNIKRREKELNDSQMPRGQVKRRTYNPYTF